MTITFNEVEKILKTLPIGYYVKREINTSLSNDSSVSYYDQMNDTICISYSQLKKSFDNIHSDDFVEENIRTMLYHEVSHAFITPSILSFTTQMNIFEDERIESVLRKYYLNVNFREFVKRVNNFHGELPTNADEAFYQLVRYRIGTDYWLKRLHNLIIKYNGLTKDSRYWNDVKNYETDVEIFYKEFITQYNSIQQNSQPNAQQNVSNDQRDSQSNTQQNISDDRQNSQSNAQKNAQNEQNAQNSDYDEYDEIIAENVVHTTTDKYINFSLIEKIKQILQSVSKSNLRNGTAINAYSGVFDTRSVIRDDCKFFVQKNRVGHVKAYSKVHLNLFIDCSGSFYESEQSANELLYALKQFEDNNPDFTFSLVTCGMGEKIIDKDKRKLHCRGSNKLDDKIFDIFNKLQLPSQVNYNIVMFDGDAFSSLSKYDANRFQKNFSAFNHSNVTIISDSDNETAITKYARSAKTIFTKNYVSELIKNVLSTLQHITR